MRSKLIDFVQSVLFAYNDNGQPLAPLNHKKITVVYPANIMRPESLVKTWNVAVNTAEPNERFETHAAWMKNILVEHSVTIANISVHENWEVRHAIAHYTHLDVENHNTVKRLALLKHNR